MADRRKREVYEIGRRFRWQAGTWRLIGAVFGFAAFPSVAALTLFNPQADTNGVTWYQAISPANGPGTTTLRVLAPTAPAPGMPHRVIMVLPVIPGVDLANEFGDGLEELRKLNVHNAYNAHIVAPSFQFVPWYANHSSDSARRYEDFMVQDLAPWARANLTGSTHDELWIVGFSKSGFGVVTLLFRNPGVFDGGAAWDLPADQADAYEWDMLANYGTDQNFQNHYRLTSNWIEQFKAPFLSESHLWLSDDHVTYYGIPTFREEVLALAGRLEDAGVQFTLADGGVHVHSWTSGWLVQAISGLQAMRGGPPAEIPVAPPKIAQDSFNRANGALGSNWARDPWWGDGFPIVGGQVASAPGSGGTYYWNATAFAADQFSEVRVTGGTGDWTGVFVRASVLSNSYVAVVKPDGAYLYSFVSGAFHLLGQDGLAWQTGDLLRLEVRTTGASTARLAVMRNGSPSLVIDDSAHFIAAGSPGIGLFGGAATAIDDWSGGELADAEPPSIVQPPPALAAADAFNRADGQLGANWMRDPFWGAGSSLVGGQVVSWSLTGGVYYWGANPFGPDQFSEVRITGAIGEWTGVFVRGSPVTSDCYVAAVKPDGTYIYSFLSGVFHQLAYDPSGWTTGDVLRMEAWSLGASAARLAVFRNGSPVIVVDDSTYVVAAGKPGIGLYGGAPTAIDDWQGGVLGGGSPPSLIEAPPPRVVADDFNRADGDLGANWVADDFWGGGLFIAAGQVLSAPWQGGGHYWAADEFKPDQYSQIRIAGSTGEWTGVLVRGNPATSDCYVVAIKPDGAHLYAFINGTFTLLAHDGTSWSTGDVLRLEVRTIGAGVVRLSLLRNGGSLLQVDEADHFIAGGLPGVGMFGGAATALDDWEGGELTAP